MAMYTPGLSQKEVAEMGRERGYAFGDGAELPEIGERIARHIDWVGYGTVTPENFADVLTMFAAHCENEDRSFTPFEFTARDLNNLTAELEDAAARGDTIDGWEELLEPWDVFDCAIAVGIAYAVHARVDALAQCADYRCSDCQWFGEADELAPLEDIEQRVSVGEFHPAGQCPACGCLIEACDCDVLENILRHALRIARERGIREEGAA